MAIQLTKVGFLGERRLDRWIHCSVVELIPIDPGTDAGGTATRRVERGVGADGVLSEEWQNGRYVDRHNKNPLIFRIRGSTAIVAGTCTLIVQDFLPDLAPSQRSLSGGCWGFSGPVPLPLWMRS